MTGSAGHVTPPRLPGSLSCFAYWLSLESTHYSQEAGEAGSRGEGA